MSDLVRRKLAELTARFGRDLCDDPKRCEALLRDVCGQHRREIFLLVNAAREAVGTELRQSSAGLSKAVLVARVTRRLHDNLGVAEELARWAVETWGLAIGVLDPSDLRLPFRCPSCGVTGTISARRAGQQATCPGCRTKLYVSEDCREFRVVPGQPPPPPNTTSANPPGPASSWPPGDAADPGDLFANIPQVPAEIILRQAICRVLADGVVTTEERAEINALRAQLGVAREVAARIVDEVREQLDDQRLHQISTLAASAAAVPPPPPAGPAAVSPRSHSDVGSLLASLKSKFTDRSNCWFAPDIPHRKLQNARNRYAPLASGDIAVFLYDDTAWGGAADGLLISRELIFAHEMWEQPKQFRLNQLRNVRVEKHVMSWDVSFNGVAFTKLHCGNKALVAEVLRGIVALQNP